MSLGTVGSGSPATNLWGHYIGNQSSGTAGLPGIGSWDCSHAPVTIQLDLANLPGPAITNILPQLNQAPSTLLFSMQDDTEVDYIKLTLQYCCVNANTTPTPTPTSTSTATPTNTATPTPISTICYIAVTATATICAGTTDIGNHCDDCTTPINLPFPFKLYGPLFNAANVSSNGTLQFSSNNPTFANTCLPNVYFSNTIFAHWDDLRTDCAGCGVFTSVGGAAPNRVFCIEWRTSYYNTPSQRANFEVTLHEGGNGTFEINFGQVDQHGSSATVGVQEGTGTKFTQYECDIANSLNPGLQVQFQSVSPCPPTPTRTNTPTRTITPTGGLSGTNTPTGGLSGTVYVLCPSASTPTATPVCPTNITPTPEPAVALAGARVQACSANPYYCAHTYTDAAGHYVLSGLPNGNYDVTVYPAASNGNLIPSNVSHITISNGGVLTGQDFTLSCATPPPAGTSISPNRVDSSGIPRVYWRSPFVLTTQGCAGGTATYQLLQGSTVVGSGGMTEGPAGTYNATVPQVYPNHGYARIVITIVCPCGGTMTTRFDLYIDPSGNVRRTDAEGGAPIDGATVTLYRSASPDGSFDQVPNGDPIMSPANQTNPDETDVDGHFGWDVIEGYYVVRAEYPGCVDPNKPDQAYVESAVLPIPPPVTDLDLRLSCPAIAATPTPTPPGMINGHLTWQGVAVANRPSITGTLILCNVDADNTYNFTTDTSGNFTVTTGLPDGAYHWKVKGGRHITTSSPTDGGDLIISGAHATQEFGTQKGGNTNTDNIINAVDFNLLKGQFGQSGVKASDFDYNLVVNAPDFAILKSNFSQAGHDLICP